MGVPGGGQDFWPPLLRLARLIPGVEYVQAQRARGVLAREVVGAMQAAGLDAFVGNASEQLAMANLASLPTVAVPVTLEPLPDAPASARRQVLSAGIFGPPDGCETLKTQDPDACSRVPVDSWPWPSWLFGVADGAAGRACQRMPAGAFCQHLWAARHVRYLAKPLPYRLIHKLSGLPWPARLDVYGFKVSRACVAGAPAKMRSPASYTWKNPTLPYTSMGISLGRKSV